MTTRGQRKPVETRPQRRPKSDLEAARGVAQWLVVYQTYNAVFKVAELALLEQHLSLPQFHLLAILKKRGGMLTTGQIGEAMVKASQTITGLVDRLEEPGMVERVFDRSDRRKTWVRLTPKGEKQLADATPIAMRVAKDLSSILTDEDLRDLEAKMDKLRGITMERLEEALARQQPVPLARRF